jgi:hypothetical protein
MIIYALSNGTLTRVLKTQAEIDAFGAPDVYTYELELDPETNPLIVNHIDTAWNDVTLIDDVLAYRGTPVPVNPPGRAWADRLREEAAETAVANIPGWATWTEAEALAWHDTNITTPLSNVPTVTTANAVAVLQGIVDLLRDYTAVEDRAQVQMLLALRNKIWPNLEGS